MSDHDAVDPGSVHTLSDEVCSSWEGKFLQFSDTSDKFDQKINLSGVSYHFNIAWIEDCPSTRYRIPDYASGGPEGDLTCGNFFKAAFEQCNNGGIGGYVDSLCARYTFTGGAPTADVS